VVQKLGAPDGNLIGFTNFEPSIASKWLELVKGVAPNVRRCIGVRNNQTGIHREAFAMFNTLENMGKILLLRNRSCEPVKTLSDPGSCLHPEPTKPAIGKFFAHFPRGSVHHLVGNKGQAKHLSLKLGMGIFA
jgi:hypothetical protein